MTAVTVTNYTTEQSAELAKRYVAGETVEVLAEAYGKTVRSVVAKLAQLGVYKAKETATKAKTVTKATLVASIALMLKLDAKALASLEKADKTALTAVAVGLATMATQLKEALEVDTSADEQ